MPMLFSATMLLPAILLAVPGPDDEATAARPADPPPAAEAFEREVRPLLISRCVSCHGPKVAKGGLRLDTREFLARGEDDEPVVRPGDPDASPLIRAVRREGDLKMPPKGKLDPEEVAVLTRWVHEGASWPDDGGPARGRAEIAEVRASHWAFRPVQAPAIPAVVDRAWPATDIDRFVLAGLERAGLAPAPAADRRALIRRATFDLIGLPPAPAEIDAFLADPAPIGAAFTRVVDRLLASPHYGERWGRHWLDLARYADTKGYVDDDNAKDRRFPFSYTYRDWVIRALNADMPYDDFLVRQIAADRLEGEFQPDIAALGFLTLHRNHDEEDKQIEDEIDVLTRTTLGLSVACARCHDHKFDPIPQADYYSLYGVFAGSKIKELPILARAEDRVALEAYNRELNTRRYAFESSLEIHRRSEFGVTRSRRAIASYLLAAQEESVKRERSAAAGKGPPEVSAAEEEAKEEGIFAREDGLDTAVIERWVGFLDGTRAENDPVFAPWHSLARLRQDRFGDEAPGIIEAFVARGEEDLMEDDEDESINPKVAALLREHPPRSPFDLARSYAFLLNRVDAEWAGKLREARRALAEPPGRLEDDDDEELRQVLRGDDSPTEIPLDMVTERLEARDEPEVAEALRALEGRIDEWKRNPDAPPHATALVDPDEPVTPRIFLRGNPASEGDEVPRRFLAVLSPDDRKPFEGGTGRLELARAIADPANPLTARVMVNRVWMHHFGRGIVASPSDFGTRGEPPTHPKLLDHLAARFIADGWSLKRLHRAIMLSKVYQQSGEASPAARRADPEDRLLGRYERRRLEVEPIRDAMLAVSGLLDPAVGGRPVDLAADRPAPRRTVYALIDRETPLGLFSAFDGANPDLHTPLRHATIVPPQALYLLNSEAVAEAARAFANRLTTTRPGDPAAQVRLAYLLAFGRQAERPEVDRAVRFLKEAEAIGSSGPEPVVSAWKYGAAAYDPEKGRVEGFRELPHFTGDSYQGSATYPDPTLSYLALNVDGGHPGDDLAHVAVRRWTAPSDGTVTISGTLAHKLEGEDKEADGVRGHVVSGRRGLLAEWVAFNAESATEIPPIEVRAGESIDFVVECRENASSDTFTWKVKIRGGPLVAGSVDDFEGPPAPPGKPLLPIEKLAQVLLMSNEFLYVD